MFFRIKSNILLVKIFRRRSMEKHSRKYEQFCWVKQKNIVMEETVYHNGERSVVCADLPQCNKCGGCKNDTLKALWINNLGEAKL